MVLTQGEALVGLSPPPPDDYRKEPPHKKRNQHGSNSTATDTQRTLPLPAHSNQQGGHRTTGGGSHHEDRSPTSDLTARPRPPPPSTRNVRSGSGVSPMTLYEVRSVSELPNLPLRKIRIFSLWGARHYLEVNALTEGWFLNRDFTDRWLYVADSVLCDGGTEE